MAFGFSKKEKLHKAIQGGDLDFVCALLNEGADPNEPMNYYHPLKRAMHAHEEDIAVLLIQHGADLKRYDYLHIAAQLAQLKVIDALLAKNPDMVHDRTESHQTVLHWAAMQNNPEVLRYFLAKGLDPQAKDSNGHTPLWHAENCNCHQSRALLQTLEKMIPPETGWKLISPQEIAQVVSAENIGYRITHIFNFRSRDRIRIAHNITTQTEAIETKNFDDISEKSSLEEALSQLIRLGGKADASSISGMLKAKPVLRSQGV